MDDSVAAHSLHLRTYDRSKIKALEYKIGRNYNLQVYMTRTYPLRRESWTP